MNGGVRQGADLEVEVVGRDGFDALAVEWDELALRTGASPFSRPGWIGPWWRAFGTGELLLLACRRGGVLTGVLPLDRRRGLLRACANVHSGLFEAVAVGSEDAEALLRLALAEGRGLTIERVEADGALATAARQLADERVCRLSTLATAASSRIKVATWEGFEAGLKSKRRSDNRRVEKRLAKLGELGFEQVEDPDRLDAAFAEFLRLEASSWKVAQGTAIRQTAAERNLYEQVVAWGTETGVGRLTFVTLDGRPIAAQVSLDGGGRRFGLKTGFDEELSRYSPGLFLQLSEIRRALQAGLSFELGTGDEALKRELCSDAWEMATIALFPVSVGGTLARAGAGARAGARRRAGQSKALRRVRDLLRRRRAQR